MKVEAMIAEDEPHARAILQELCNAVDWIDLRWVASDGLEAVRLIDQARPQLVFLDVRMPEASGIEVLRRIQHSPAVVFTTAYDEYAVSAFELGAIDYLLKPFGESRFRSTLERVRRRLPHPDPAARVAGLASDAFGRGSLSRVFVRDKDRIIPIDVQSITHVEAQDDYCLIHATRGSFLVHLPISQVGLRLDPKRFLRVHRSFLVNTDAIQAIRRYDERRYELTLSNGRTVVASRTGSQMLKALAW